MLDLVGFLIQTVTTFDPGRCLHGDRFDQTFNANYIKAIIGLCNLHLLCKRGPKHRIIQGGRTRLGEGGCEICTGALGVFIY